MYNKNKPSKTSINLTNVIYEGESIEQRVERILNNGEPIADKDSQPTIYTQRSEGVKDEYNIRFDKFDAAIEAADVRTKKYQFDRAEGISKRMQVIKGGKEDENPGIQPSVEAKE